MRSVFDGTTVWLPFIPSAFCSPDCGHSVTQSLSSPNTPVSLMKTAVLQTAVDVAVSASSKEAPAPRSKQDAEV